jgi:2-iminobutanoate/2-iminopropanoate deaminase
MEKQIINSTHAPAPIGPYSQAVEVHNMLFVSGQIALIPGTNDLNLESIEKETKQVLDNLNAILHEAGMTFSNIVKSSIFLSDMALFAEVNKLYESYFSTEYPARETVQVAGLPRGVNVEISVIASR